jgi:hypothetical protein
MARQDKKAYELTDAEQRDLIALLPQGRPLPERYRFVLFEDKREVELVWNGKTRDVCTRVLPFQSLAHVDAPRRARAHPLPRRHPTAYCSNINECVNMIAQPGGWLCPSRPKTSFP